MNVGMLSAKKSRNICGTGTNVAAAISRKKAYESESVHADFANVERLYFNIRRE